MLFAGIVLCGNAMDIVTLHSGKTLRGEISRRDEDGSLLINRTNRTKWYVMPEEIASVSNDGVPFKYESGEGSGMSYDVTAYVGYEQIMPTSLTIDGNKAKIYTASPGFVAGVGINIPLKWNLSFLPAIELAYSKWERKDKFEIDGCEVEASGDISGWLNLRLPLQIGYEIPVSKDLKLMVHTGPVVEAYVGYAYGYGDSGMAFDDSYDGFIGGSYNSDTGRYEYAEGGWSYNRMNLDWRFGVKASYKRLSLGLAFAAGMTNRTKDAHYNGSSCKSSMKQNSLQISLGWTF